MAEDKKQTFVTLAHGHLHTLCGALAVGELQELVEQLRLFALEARGGGRRRRWAAATAAAAAAIGEPPLVSGHSLVEAAAPPGLALEERPGMGRVLVATRDFEPGESFYIERPLLVIPGCAVAATYGTGPVMAALDERHPGHTATLDMDVLCDAFAKLEHSQLDMLRGHESHGDANDYEIAQICGAVAAIAAEQRLVESSEAEAELAWFLRVISVNGHTAPWADGVAVFAWTSMFVHSCWPNATFALEEYEEGSRTGKASVAAPRALCAISKGEDISMSYLPFKMLMASTEARRKLLREQKNFDCACPRCAGMDSARALPCPGCGGFCWPAGSGPDDWFCVQCAAPPTPSQTCLQSEERWLERLSSSFYEAEGEQSVRTLLAAVDEALAPNGQQASKHFLRAWLMHSLVLRVLFELQESLRERPREGEMLAPARAGRAAAALWHLERWVQQHAPACRHLLAEACVVPVVRVLLAARRADEAAQLASEYEACLAAAFGPCDSDVRLLGNTRATCPTQPGIRTFTCEACGKKLCDGRGEAEAGGAPGCGLPLVAWCPDCELAPFCGAQCLAAGRTAHARLCAPVRKGSQEAKEERLAK